jgi:hypothetical protein
VAYLRRHGRRPARPLTGVLRPSLGILGDRPQVVESGPGHCQPSNCWTSKRGRRTALPNLAAAVARERLLASIRRRPTHLSIGDRSPADRAWTAPEARAPRRPRLEPAAPADRANPRQSPYPPRQARLEAAPEPLPARARASPIADPPPAEPLYSLATRHSPR